MKNPILILILLIIQLFNCSFAQSRRDFDIPDINGYIILKGDFHTHTINSDGQVMPEIRIKEAWRDGLDVIAITDHIYIPYTLSEKNIDENISYETALNQAHKLGLILINATEITCNMPPGHLNALFMKDNNKLKKNNYKDAIAEAHLQGAFIIWNHPGWKAQQPDTTIWFDEHTELYNKGMLNGIEVVNENDYYPIAFNWALQKKLTVFANSDIHESIEFVYPVNKGLHRPITLVFVKERNENGLKEAFQNQRTIAYYKQTLIGSKDLVQALVEKCLIISNPQTELNNNNKTTVLISNKSDFQFELETIDNNKYNLETAYTIPPHGTIAVMLNNIANNSVSNNAIQLSFKVKNTIIDINENLILNLSFNIFTWGNIRLDRINTDTYKVNPSGFSPDIQLFYTSDGNDADINSNPLSKSFEAKDMINIKIAAFNTQKKKISDFNQLFVSHKAISKNIVLSYLPEKKYFANGALSLIDGILATTDFTSGKWLGFKQKDMEAIIDLEKETEISLIEVSFLESQKSWIFLPKQVEFYYSSEGKNYINCGNISYSDKESNNSNIVKAIFDKKLKTRYIKIIARNTAYCPKWHYASGNEAWLFSDEIIIK